MKSKILTLIILFFVTCAVAQISNTRNKTAQQLDGITPGVTNIATRTYLDTYIFQRFVEFTNRFEADHYNTFDYTSTQTALNDINTANAVLIVSTKDTITSPINVPSNVAIMVRPGGGWYSADTVTVTFNGQFFSGAQQIFFGNATGSWNVPNQVGFVEWWGAVGDSTTDDRHALQMAFDSELAIRLLPGSKYSIDSTVTVNDKNVDIGMLGDAGNKPVIYWDHDDAAKALVFENNFKSGDNTGTGDTSKVVADATVNSIYFPVFDASPFSRGQLISVDSDSLWYYDNRTTLTKGEMHIVESIDTSTTPDRIYVYGKIWDTYDVSNETVVITGHTANRLTLKNFRIWDIDTSFVSSQALNIYRYSPVLLDGVETRTADTGTQIVRCHGVRVYNHRAHRINIGQNSSAYGVQALSTYDLDITNSTFIAHRRGVDLSALNASPPCRQARVHHSTFIGRSSFNDGFGTHSPAELVSFDNNIVQGIMDKAVFIRSPDTQISNNMFTGSFVSIIEVRFGNSLNVTGNYFKNVSAMSDSNTVSPTSNVTQFLRFKEDTDGTLKLIDDVWLFNNIVITGNTANGISGNFITFNSGIDSVANMVVTGNTVVYTGTGTGSQAFLSGSTTLINSNVIGNTYSILDQTVDFELLRNVTFEWRNRSADQGPTTIGHTDSAIFHIHSSDVSGSRVLFKTSHDATATGQGVEIDTEGDISIRDGSITINDIGGGSTHSYRWGNTSTKTDPWVIGMDSGEDAFMTDGIGGDVIWEVLNTGFKYTAFKGVTAPVGNTEYIVNVFENATNDSLVFEMGTGRRFSMPER